MCEGGGNCLKYTKRGWNRTGEGTQKFKKGRQGVGALKMGGGGRNPLTNYGTLVLDLISFWQCLGLKKNQHKNNFHYAAIFMMALQILKYVDFTKTQKSRYFENKTFFLQIKKFKGYFMAKNSFVAFCRVNL